MQIFKAEDRGTTSFGWLKSYHSFSFGDYYDRDRMHFNRLRVINDDYVGQEGGFPMHPHKNMEIITYVMSGALAHSDSLGNGSVIRPGEIQVMSAGTGIQHSEWNHSKTEEVHLLQIWIMPDFQNVEPRYQQAELDQDVLREDFALAAGPTGSGAPFEINTAALVYVGWPAKGQILQRSADPELESYLHVAEGEISVNGTVLKTGDAVGVTDGSELVVEVLADSQLLLFEMAK